MLPLVLMQAKHPLIRVLTVVDGVVIQAGWCHEDKQLKRQRRSTFSQPACLPACPTAVQPLGQPRHDPSSSLQNESCQVFQGCSLFWLCSRFGWLSSGSARCEKIKDRERRMRGQEGKYFWLQSRIKLLCQDCNLEAMIPYFIATEKCPLLF